MGALFVVARLLEPRHAWLGYVRATAEASLVGGIADWFAITALFRHPLNLPIPHTAIIPNRKDRIGRSLGNFVQNNFLSPEVLSAKLRAAQISRRAAEWLAQPEYARTAAQNLASVLRGAGAVVRDEDVHALLDRSVVEPLRRMPIAPVLSKGLELLTVDDRHQQLLDRVIGGLTTLVAENEALIRDRIREESPWWVPELVDDKIHRKVLGGIERTLYEVGVDPDHRLRRQFDQLLSEWIVQLQESPEVIARAEAIKQQVLDPETSGRIAASLWNEAKTALGRQDQSSEGGAIDAVARGLSALARAALEAVCYQTRDLIEAMRGNWQTQSKSVLHVDGGMVASDWTMQRLADILDAPVERPVIQETTALGAAWLAGRGVCHGNGDRRTVRKARHGSARIPPAE